MQFDSGSTRVVRRGFINGAKLNKTSREHCITNRFQEDKNKDRNFGHNLQMYNVPPSEEVSLTEFDDIALERLKALKVVEDIKERHTVGSIDYELALTRELSKIFPIATGAKTIDLEKARRRDLIGHFILRLAFCRSPESTKWLVTQEVDLFRYRFNKESPSSIKEFLRQNNMVFDTVESSEKDVLMEQLSRGSGVSLDFVQTTDYYKIDFIDALDLVRRRRVYLKNGMAYIAFNDLVGIICNQLKMNMNAAMARAFKHLAVVEEEGRLLPRLARLANNAYSGKQYSGKDNDDKITRQMLDSLSISSFPPCMKQCHSRMRTDHHLRHGSRRQYGLFLKGIGLSLEEALLFMREEFTKKIDADKFEKQYAYNIRHMYGKEGRRMDYPALSCAAIINGSAPAVGDCHGCPFKHSDPQLLVQRLDKEGLNKEQVNQIVNLSKSNGFDKACTRFFEYSHKMEEGALGQIITHPNQFFELSQDVLAGKRAMDNHLIPTQTQPTIQNNSISDDKFSDEE